MGMRSTPNWKPQEVQGRAKLESQECRNSPRPALWVSPRRAAPKAVSRKSGPWREACPTYPLQPSPEAVDSEPVKHSQEQGDQAFPLPCTEAAPATSLYQRKNDKLPPFPGLPRWLSGRESACSAGDTGEVGSIPGSGRSSGEGNGNSFEYSCLGNPMDRGTGGLQSMGSYKSRT